MTANSERHGLPTVIRIPKGGITAVIRIPKDGITASYEYRKTELQRL
ncbi:MAG: hypothetical protein LBP62_08400 [Clostridiales bacterium]|nr:hypothetical protein [Clostridiales bacterium]